MKFKEKVRSLLENRINYTSGDNRFHDRGKKDNVIIHHYCPFTMNAGDHFVIRSIRSSFREYLPRTLFLPKAIAKNRGWGKPVGLRRENILFSNRYADAIFLGGSDQYNNWSPRIEAEEIDHLIPPLFLIGLGVSSRDIDEPPYLKQDRYRNDILLTNRKAVFSSVRDLATKQFLENLGYHDSVLTGCPALYLFDRPLSAPDPCDPILITFPYPLARTEKASHKYRLLIRLMKDLIEYFQERKIEYEILCHDDRDVPPAQMEFRESRIFFSNYVEDYYSKLDGAQMVIGSRLHATILALGMGVPAININLDLRGTGFSETFALTGWNLNYIDIGLTDEVIDRIKQIQAGDLSGFDSFKAKKDYYKNIYNGFMENSASYLKQKLSL